MEWSAAPACPPAWLPTWLPTWLPIYLVQGVCSDAASFDLPAAVVAGAVEELGTAAELAASMGDEPLRTLFNDLGDRHGERGWPTCF
jgi:hypothetical protein